MILTKEVEIKPAGKTVQYYKNLGYNAKRFEPLIVKIEDLLKGSHASIEVLCDMCNKNKMIVAYDVYNRVVKSTGGYVCKECAPEKRSQTIQEKYGVRVAAQSKEIRCKMEQTNLKRYGVKNPAKLQEIKDKTANTNMKRYGGVAPCSSKVIKEKIAKTLYANSSQMCSRQQLYLFNLYNTNGDAQLNYPISYYNADICFPKDKLDIELDCGGHNLSVKIGRITQEEFNQREIIRNNIIKREGYKQMRIISSKDLLPSDATLLRMLSEAKLYFSTTLHSWIEFNIDTSSLRNAEYKDGILYDYGDLRRIT